MVRIRTRSTDLLGIDVPIVQAPMGWIARAQQASAVPDGAVKAEEAGVDRPTTSAAVALSGQVAGRIDEMRPVAETIDDCVAGFRRTIDALSKHRP